MNENDFYAILAPRLKEWGDHERIENSIGGGTPDINFAIDGTQGWIETKIVHHGDLYFEKFQIPWMRRRLRHTRNTHIWVLCTDGAVLWAYPASEFVRAPTRVDRKWTVVSQADVVPVVHSGKPWPWNVLRGFLTTC